MSILWRVRFISVLGKLGKIELAKKVVDISLNQGYDNSVVNLMRFCAHEGIVSGRGSTVASRASKVTGRGSSREWITSDMAIAAKASRQVLNPKPVSEFNPTVGHVVPIKDKESDVVKVKNPADVVYKSRNQKRPLKKPAAVVEKPDAVVEKPDARWTGKDKEKHKASAKEPVSIVDRVCEVAKHIMFHVEDALKNDAIEKLVDGCKAKENPEFKAKVNVKRKMILSKEDDNKKKFKVNWKRRFQDRESDDSVPKKVKKKLTKRVKKEESDEDTVPQKGKKKEKQLTPEEAAHEKYLSSFPPFHARTTPSSLFSAIKTHGGDKIEVTPSKIHDMLGVPIGGYSLFDLDERETDHEFVSKWASQFYPLELKKVRVNDIARKLVAAQEIDFLFKLLYLDSTKFDKFLVVRTRPAIRNWSSYLMKQRQELELKDHVLGLLDLHDDWNEAEVQESEGFIGFSKTSEKERSISFEVAMDVINESIGDDDNDNDGDGIGVLKKMANDESVDPVDPMNKKLLFEGDPLLCIAMQGDKMIRFRVIHFESHVILVESQEIQRESLVIHFESHVIQYLHDSLVFLYSESVFETHSGEYSVYGLRLNMETLAPGLWIDANVIDCWGAILNHEERFRVADSKSRHFFPTGCITKSMFDGTLATDEAKWDSFSNQVRVQFGGRNVVVGLTGKTSMTILDNSQATYVGKYKEVCVVLRKVVFRNLKAYGHDRHTKIAKLIPKIQRLVAESGYSLICDGDCVSNLPPRYFYMKSMCLAQKMLELAKRSNRKVNHAKEFGEKCASEMMKLVSDAFKNRKERDRI
ncbi:hypothetical protein Tco_0328369 [Tanacetum coccineum]